MIEMVRRFLRQKLGSPLTLIALSFLALLSALSMAASSNPQGGLEGLARGLVVFLLSEGLSGRDEASGALQMILARPVRRTEYLVGRYLGVLACFVIFLVASALASIALSPLFGTRPDGRALLVSLGGGLLDAALLAAVLAFFGTFLPGWGNVLAYVMIYLGITVPAALAIPLHRPNIASVINTIRQNVLPLVSWHEVLRGQNVLRASVGQYGLALAGFLLAALVVFSRREFAYGQD